MKHRKTVTLVNGANDKPGAKTSAWAYDVTALAKAKQVTQRTVWAHIERKRLDPADLASVVQWLGHSV